MLLKGVDSPPCEVAKIPILLDLETHPHSLAAIFDYPKTLISNLKKKPLIKICFQGTQEPFDLTSVVSQLCSFHNGWVALPCKNKTQNPSAQTQLLHLTVRTEPDQRFIFRFDGEPECSPQVFQVKGDVKQPVYTCKYNI
jgi:hypothetical protein